MRILFFITSYSRGKGGHFNSLDHISRELSKDFNIKIILLGKGRSPVIEDNPFYNGKINFNGISLIKFNSEIKNILKIYKPDIIHCFDPDSLLILQSMPATIKYKFVLNRCGGQNPGRRNWIVCDNLVLFSKENYDWFKNNIKYKNSNVHLIPNRVKSIEVDYQLKEENSTNLDNAFNFVRIARIGSKNHLESLWKSIYLIETLNKKYSVKLYIIGAIEVELEYLELNNYTEKNNLPIEFITDERTNKASNLLYLADCVIGVGRSLMEAMSIGIPVLVPVKNSNIPILLKEENFENYLSTNFSQRSIATSEDVNNNIQDIIKLITSDEYYKKNKKLTLELFQKNLSIDNISKLYKNVYDMALINKKKCILYPNILYTCQLYYSHWKSMVNKYMKTS